MRKICTSCIGHRGSASSTVSLEPIVLRSSSQANDRQLEDWLRGNYHVKLKSNLMITQDYHLAAGRTKRDFQNNYFEDGSKKPQNRLVEVKQISP